MAVCAQFCRGWGMAPQHPRRWAGPPCPSPGPSPCCGCGTPPGGRRSQGVICRLRRGPRSAAPRLAIWPARNPPTPTLPCHPSRSHTYPHPVLHPNPNPNPNLNHCPVPNLNLSHTSKTLAGIILNPTPPPTAQPSPGFVQFENL